MPTTSRSIVHRRANPRQDALECYGSESRLVSGAVFKTVVAPEGAGWVRFPHIPAIRFKTGKLLGLMLGGSVL